MGRLGQAGEGVQGRLILLAGVGLTGNAKPRLEIHLLCHHLIEGLNLVGVAVKETQEARLGSRRTLRAAKAQPVKPELHLLQVEQEILSPDRRALADGGQLGRLKMRIGERRELLVLEREPFQGAQETDESRPHQLEGLAVENAVGIVGHVAARGAKVDDPRGRGTGLAKGLDVRHDVVAQLALVLRDPVVIYIVKMGAQLIQLGLADVESKLGLGFRQRKPEPAPGSVAIVVGKNPQHLGAGIALDEGVLIGLALD